MTRRVMHDLCCVCGRHFRRSLYHAVDVGQQPGLRYAVIAGVLNVVQCPSCERVARVNIPVLYHDPRGGRLLYVYPVEDDAQSDELRDQIARLGDVPDEDAAVASGTRRPTVMFGLERLAGTIADTLADAEQPGSITVDVRPGIKPERAGRIMVNRIALQIGGYVYSWREGGRLHLQILGPRSSMEQLTISIA